MHNSQYDIEKYLRGELSPEEMHVLEKKALNDPFLADALEGASGLSAKEFSQDVVSLRKNLSKKRRLSIWIVPMRIAAGLVLLSAATFLIWQFAPPKETTQPLALEKSEQTIQEEKPQNSVEPLKDADKNAGVTKEYPGKTPTPILEIKPQSKIATAESKPSFKRDSTALAFNQESQQKFVKKDEPKTTEGYVKQPIAEAKPIETTSVPTVEDDISPSALKRAKTSDLNKREAVPLAKVTTKVSRTIKGKVTSQEDGSRLPGVNVIVKGTTIGTATNVSGEYEIELTTNNPMLIFSFIGLQSKEVPVNDRAEVDVQMNMDAAQLSEVVVTAYGIAQDSNPPTVDLAHPETGYREFKKYLEENIQYPQEAIINKVEGRVTVEFSVEANGALTDFQVVRGVGHGCDEELIRLIKEGPEWIPTKKDDLPVRDKVKVRLKFNLPK